MKDAFKSLIECLDYFQEEKTCYEFLEAQIWEDGKAVCPHCGSTKVYTTKSRSNNPAKKDIPEYRCTDKTCTKKFTATVGTIFESAKIPLRTWYGAIYLASSSKKGISSLQISRQLNLTQKSSWYLLQRIRTMFKDNEPTMLRGMVEADETYVGGKNKNRHADKKISNSQGRSSAYKTPVVGLLERDGKVVTFVTPNTEAEILIPLIEEFVDKDATLVTDAYKSYSSAKNHVKHITVKHTDGGYVVKEGTTKFHTQNIENYWSVLKRGIIGIYHYVSPKHVHRYCDEFAYRYNSRTITDRERFTQAIKQSIGIKLPYSTLIS